MASPGSTPSTPHPHYIVSACLAGIACTFRGKDRLNAAIKKMVDRGDAIPLCPELLGGLGTPRRSAEMCGGDGADVLRRKAVVVTERGDDLTHSFIRGARATLAVARAYGIRRAILASKSPSCGNGTVYDGTFTRTLRAGSGVTAALLEKSGIAVITEADLGSLKYLKCVPDVVQYLKKRRTGCNHRACSVRSPKKRSRQRSSSRMPQS